MFNFLFGWSGQLRVRVRCVAIPQDTGKDASSDGRIQSDDFRVFVRFERNLFHSPAPPRARMGEIAAVVINGHTMRIRDRETQTSIAEGSATHRQNATAKTAKRLTWIHARPESPAGERCTVIGAAENIRDHEEHADRIHSVKCPEPCAAHKRERRRGQHDRRYPDDTKKPFPGSGPPSGTGTEDPVARRFWGVSSS